MGNKIETTFSPDDARQEARSWSSITFVNSAGLPARSKREAHLGSGAYASVYRCNMSIGGSTRNQASVAVKILNQASDAEYPDLCRRAEREATQLAGIAGSVSSRDEIVSVFGIVKGELTPEITKIFRIPNGVERVGIVVSLCPGGDLEGLLHPNPKWIIQPGPMSLEFKLGLIRNIAKGLRYLHGANFVHGDLKPQNILLCDKDHIDPKVQLSDFGLFDSKQLAFDSSRSLKGFLSYCAPELLAQVVKNLSDFQKSTAGSDFKSIQRKKERKAAKEAVAIKPVSQQDHPIGTILVHLNIDDGADRGSKTSGYKVLPPASSEVDSGASGQSESKEEGSKWGAQAKPEDKGSDVRSSSRHAIKGDKSRTRVDIIEVSKANRGTDIYAFGIIAWEIMSGLLPYPEDVLRDESMLLNNVLCEDEYVNRPALVLLPNDCPAQLKTMMASCWSHDCSTRMTATECFSTATHVLNVASCKKFDIFFSHAWVDKALLKFIVSMLTDIGYRVYYDENDANNYLQGEAIKNSTVVLVCANSTYQERRNCMYELRELGRLYPDKIITILVEGIRKYPSKIWTTSGVPISQEIWDILKLQAQTSCCDLSKVGQNALWQTPDVLSAALLDELRKALRPLIEILTSVGCEPSMKPT